MPHTLGHKMGIHTYCLSPQAYCLNALFYIYQTINLNSDLLPVIWFQHFIALWKTYYKRKQIAKFLQRYFAHIFAQTHLKRICTTLVFLEYTFTFCKFCKYFCTFEFAWSRPFQKCIIFHISLNFSFFCTLLLYN